MGKFTPQATAPRYMEEFRCAGADCPESCCGGWTVSIDKATYKSYRSIKIEPLASLVKASVRRRDQPSANHFASVKLDEGANCPFLDVQQMCQIQSSLGESALSNTCRNYPRIYTSDGGDLAVYATLSCPEAAKLALQDRDAMDTVSFALPFANATLLTSNITRPVRSQNEEDVFKLHAPLVREALEDIIRSKDLSAADAMIVCGLMLNSCVQAVGQCQTRAEAEVSLLATLQRYLASSGREHALQHVGVLQVPKQMQLDLLTTAMGMLRAQQSTMRASFTNLVREFITGLDWQDGDLESNTLRYVEAEESYFRPFDEQHRHLLKNYLLNDFGRSLFPMSGVAGIEAEFMSLAVRFALLKLFLVGLAGSQGKDFGAQHYVRATYVFARNVEHNRSFIPSVLSSLLERGALTLPMLAVLVK